MVRTGRSSYVRQMREMTLSVPREGVRTTRLNRYPKFCGRTLARAHAKSENPAIFSGYHDKWDTFDKAIRQFALAYADQNERDYAALVAAVK